MPRPVEALPCGSRSTISTCSPIAASAVPRLIAVVVLPTPPFWLARASTRRGDGVGIIERGCLVRPLLRDATFRTIYQNDMRPRIGLTANQGGLNFPISRCLGQFSPYILSLG